MKITLKELRATVESIMTEAKKKKKDTETEKSPGYTYDKNLDFSKPLGDTNLYKQQGAASFGPQTSSGDTTPDQTANQDRLEDTGMPKFLKPVVNSEGTLRYSAWSTLNEFIRRPNGNNIWESAMHWYDHKGYGLGHATTESIEKKKEKDDREAKKNKK